MLTYLWTDGTVTLERLARSLLTVAPYLLVHSLPPCVCAQGYTWPIAELDDTKAMARRRMLESSSGVL